MFASRFARACVAALAAAAALTAASVAQAQQAYVSVRTTLRAGPDSGYPQVAWLGGGSSVYVNGCVRGYRWCEVSAGGLRGWANARHLQYLFQNRRVVIYGNGATYGFPLVGFALGSYWDSYYRDRPWYNNRSHWNGWQPGHPAPHFDNHRPQHFAHQAVAPRPHVNHVQVQEFHPSRPRVVQHQQPMQAPVQHQQMRQQPHQTQQAAQPHQGNQHRGVGPSR
jgi:uncharacterized protein YraI